MRDFRYWRNLTLFGLSSLILGFTLGILLLIYLGVRQYVHPHRSLPDVHNTPAHHNIPYKDVILETQDGLQLTGWYTPPKNRAVILVGHGHSGYRWIDMHVFFAQAGYGVISWDFRAHGGSEGEISSIGYFESLDIEAALDYVLNQEGVNHVGAWGGSMGGVAMIGAAAHRLEIEAVVVDSAFAAVEDELGVVVRWPLLHPIVRFLLERETGLKADMLKPEDDIGRISPRPVFIIQGLADEVISIDSAERLYAAAGKPRFLWAESNVGHLGMISAFPEEYKDRVIKFFDQALFGQ